MSEHTTTGVLLDAGSFPLLMENILSHLPLAKLPSLRPLSTNIRTAVDRLITSYAVQLVDHRWRCAARCSPPCGVITWPRNGHCTAHCVQDELPGTLVKVILFTGGVEEYLHDVLTRLNTAHTFQRSGTSALFYRFPTDTVAGSSIKTMVDYLPLNKLPWSATTPRQVSQTQPLQAFLTHPLDLTSTASSWKMSAASRRVAAYADRRRRQAEVRYHHLVIPTSIRRYVMHVSLNQLQGTIQQGRTTRDTPSRGHDMKEDIRFTFDVGLSQFVLVLWPHFSVIDLPNRRWVKEPFPQVPKTLLCLLWAAATAALSGSVTIVNAHRLSPLLFGQYQECADDPNDVVDKVKNILHQQLGCMVDNEMAYPRDNRRFDQRVEDAFKGIRFVSLEAWWNELGNTRRRYEGLALGADRIDGNETYSLRLVEQ